MGSIFLPDDYAPESNAIKFASAKKFEQLLANLNPVLAQLAQGTVYSASAYYQNE